MGGGGAVARGVVVVVCFARDAWEQEEWALAETSSGLSIPSGRLCCAEGNRPFAVLGLRNAGLPRCNAHALRNAV